MSLWISLLWNGIGIGMPLRSSRARFSVRAEHVAGTLPNEPLGALWGCGAGCALFGAAFLCCRFCLGDDVDMVGLV